MGQLFSSQQPRNITHVPNNTMNRSIRKDDEYLASPTPASRFQTRTTRDAKTIPRFEAGAADLEDATQQPQSTPDTFRVQDLPRELRCLIWEWNILHDDVKNLDDHPDLQKFGNVKPSCAIRRYVPGYFRPTALLTRHEEMLRHDYRQTYVLDRIHALFLVSKETYLEAREVAWRHVFVEIDKLTTRKILDAWEGNLRGTNIAPMLRNMRNLYIGATAQVPKPMDFTAPMAFKGPWPLLEFNWRNVPLFHVSIRPDGSSITLSSQRNLVALERSKLDAAIAQWYSTLAPNHRFAAKDLVTITKLIQNVQEAKYPRHWTLRIDEQDKNDHRAEMESQDKLEWRTGDREWKDAWMKLNPDFRVVIAKLDAPCLK